MCLIIHKPAGVRIPASVIQTAASANPHGMGLMRYGEDGISALRREATDSTELLAWQDSFVEEECAIHLRFRTRGEVTVENSHPFEIVRGVFLMHNGTLPIKDGGSGRSDSRLFVEDYLRPILLRQPELLHDTGFQSSLAEWAGPHNRFVLMDGNSRRTLILNRSGGCEAWGLWLSNARWLDLHLDSLLSSHRVQTSHVF